LLWKQIHEPWWTWSGLLWIYAVVCVVSATLIGPLASIRITLRRRPGGITGASETIDLAHPQGADTLIGNGRRSWLLRLPRNESFRLRLREWQLALPELPDALNGLHIVQISDLHFAPCFERRYFELVADACRDWRTDLIVVTGDLVDHDDAIAWIEPILGPLEAGMGKFAVLGNHDESHHPQMIVDALGRAGFETLDGRWITIDLDGTKLAIGGTSAPWGAAFERRDVPDADFRLLLSHSPDMFYRAEGWDVDLMLSGHNHGGQIRLPFVGPVFMPSRYSRRFDRGFFRQRRTLMYVSEGVAGKHPVRYGCVPEISRFVLRAAALPRGMERHKTRGRKYEAIESD
jgi:predicted MPP superfamily phosphohydrolase